MTTRKTYWQRRDPQETLRSLRRHRTMILGSDLVQSRTGLAQRFGIDLGARSPSWHLVAVISRLVEHDDVVAFDLEGEVAMLPAEEWAKELAEQPELAESRIEGPDFLERLLA